VLSRTVLIAVPLLMVLWGNAHGSFLLGLVLLGAFLLGRILAVCTEARSWNPFRAVFDAQALRLFVVLLVSTVAIALLNPHGPAAFFDVFKMSRHPNLTTLEEWGPLEFTSGPGGHWGYLAILVLILVSQAISPRPLTGTQLILLCTFGIWPCFQQRMMVWWVMLVPWLVLPLWSATADTLSWSWLRQRSIPSLVKTAVAVFLLVPLLLLSSPWQWLRHGRPEPVEKLLSPVTPWKVADQLTGSSEAAPRWYPALAQVLKKDYPEGRFTGRVFASEALADYLIWSMPEQSPVLVYTHAHLFPPSHWNEFLTVKYGAVGWWEVLDRYRVNLVLVDEGQHANLIELLRNASADWEVVLDESGNPARPGSPPGLFLAVRKHPK
jgi:hypothetical protein